jgi:hypothetical protein
LGFVGAPAAEAGSAFCAIGPHNAATSATAKIRLPINLLPAPVWADERASAFRNKSG